MSEFDYLYVFAEMSAILIGFTTIVVTFRRTQDKSEFSSYTLRNLIQRGLATAVFATLPGLISHIGQITDYVWQLSSLAFFLFSFTSSIVSYLWFRAIEPDDLPFSAKRYYFLSGIGWFFVLLTGLNVWLGISWIYMLHVTYVFLSTGLLVITYIESTNVDA